MTSKRSVKTDDYNRVFNPQGCYEDVPAQTLASTQGGMSGIVKFYEDDAMARRIVDVVPEEMVSPGFKLKGVSDDSAFQSAWDTSKAEVHITDALCWSRLFGGSGILALVNDGGTLRQQVNPEGATLEAIRVYDRTQISVESRESNLRSPRYGMPKTYRINPGNSMREFIVHHSRIHIIDGERVPNSLRNSNDGWGVGVLNKKIIEAIIDYNKCENYSTELLKRKQQAVWKAKELAMLTDDNEGVYAARIRLAQVDGNSGVGNTIGIDADDEDYSILNSDVSGVPELVQQKIDRIVAYSGIHEIILKNKNTGGISSSQNTALQTFYKLIDRKRNEDYKPILEFLLPFMIHEDEWSVEFEPLSIPSDKEKSEIFKNNVDSVCSLVDNQIIDTDEARDAIIVMNAEITLKPGGPDIQDDDIDDDGDDKDNSKEQVKEGAGEDEDSESNS